MNRLGVFVVAGSIAALTSFAAAGDGTESQQAQNAAARPTKLMVGDAAPKLSVANWIKGEPVQSFDRGKVYVVEFWATWCPPCIRSIPHVSALQNKYADKGVTMIGMTSPDRRNTLARVRSFVAEQGSKMAYTVAFDDPRRLTDQAWMNAASQNGIPTAFIVDRAGRLAWIGHPMMMDEPLGQIVEGNFDISASARNFARQVEGQSREMRIQQEFNRFASLLIEEKDYDKAYAVGRKLVAGDAKNHADALGAIAWIIVDPERDIKQRDTALALDAASRAVKLKKWTDPSTIDTLAWVHFTKGDVEKAIEVQQKAIALAQGEMKTFAEHSMEVFKGAKTGSQ